jgi:glucose-1-phosphate thymidylyltransferase
MGDMVRCLGSGAKFGCDLTYRVQERPAGIAHALSLARNFAGGSRICAILGDNIFETPISSYAEAFRQQEAGARVVLARVADPTRFGVAALDERQILHIEEKPEAPPSDFAVVGLYFYDADVFAIIDAISPSARGEYEITSVNNVYASQRRLAHDVVKGRWTDAGTFESLMEAHKIVTSRPSDPSAFESVTGVGS